MQTFLAALAVLPYDQRVATRWGEIQAYAQLRGRPRPANDSWIAACCLVPFHEPLHSPDPAMCRQAVDHPVRRDALVNVLGVGRPLTRGGAPRGLCRTAR
jgi:hypothetical protein